MGAFPNFETANYTVVDASHITFTLNKVHAAGAVIAVGGLCGYGIEQTVDTMGAVRQVFPVIGSPNATSLYYAAASTPSARLMTICKHERLSEHLGAGGIDCRAKAMLSRRRWPATRRWM